MILSVISLQSLEPQLYHDFKFDGNKGDYNFVTHNGLAYVSCDDGIHGRELWVFNGRTDDMHMLKDINPNGDSNPMIINTEMDDFILFSAEDDTSSGIWRTDGTEEGTTLIKRTLNFRGGTNGLTSRYFQNIKKFKDRVYYIEPVETLSDLALWSTDGTTEGTKVIYVFEKNFSNQPYRFQLLGEKLTFFFQGRGGFSESELWSTDGRTEGTMKIADRGSIGLNGRFFDVIIGDKLFFPYSKELFSDIQLWVTDGTKEGTKQLVKNKESFVVSGDCHIVYNDKLYFCGSENNSGNEPWVTDGTDEGTYMLKDINPDGDSDPEYLQNSSEKPDKLTLLAEDEFGRNKVYVSDGTTTNTRVVNPTVKYNVRDYDDYLLDNEKFYFANDISETGQELWVADLIKDSVYMVKDIEPGKNSSVIAFSDILLYGSAIFSTRKQEDIYSIWMSDGTEEGTFNLDESLNGFTEEIGDSEIINGVGYFVESKNREVNPRLWRSDMTKAGSAIIEPLDATNKKQIYYKKFMVQLRGNVFFFADYYGKGHQLYRLSDSKTSVEDTPQPGLLTVYPNPAKDYIQLELSTPMQLSIINSTGAKVKDYGIVDNGKLNVAELHSGVYFVVDELGINIAKFVKE